MLQLTATNRDLLSEIGCVIVDVPANFSIAGLGAPGSNAGDSWVAGLSGNRVTVRTTSGGDRLALLQWVSFTVRAVARSTGSLAWNANAYARHDCRRGGSPLGLPPVVLVTGPAVTPSPTPQSTPQPTPTPTPTAPPTPRPAASPTPLPAATPPLPSSGGARPGPTASPREAAPPGSSASPAGRATVAPAASGSAAALPQPGSDEGGVAGPASSSTGPASQPPTIRFDERRLDLAGASVGLLAGVEIWAVPAATIAVPGLLVILWVAIQALGAIAWMPAVRRLQREDGPRATAYREKRPAAPR